MTPHANRSSAIKCWVAAFSLENVSFPVDLGSLKLSVDTSCLLSDAHAWSGDHASKFRGEEIIDPGASGRSNGTESWKRERLSQLWHRSLFFPLVRLLPNFERGEP